MVFIGLFFRNKHLNDYQTRHKLSHSKFMIKKMKFQAKFVLLKV